jgi:hypothetical protein
MGGPVREYEGGMEVAVTLIDERRANDKMLNGM